MWPISFISVLQNEALTLTSYHQYRENISSFGCHWQWWILQVPSIGMSVWSVCLDKTVSDTMNPSLKPQAGRQGTDFCPPQSSGYTHGTEALAFVSSCIKAEESIPSAYSKKSSIRNELLVWMASCMDLSECFPSLAVCEVERVGLWSQRLESVSSLFQETWCPHLWNETKISYFINSSLIWNKIGTPLTWWVVHIKKLNICELSPLRGAVIHCGVMT